MYSKWVRSVVPTILGTMAILPDHDLAAFVDRSWYKVMFIV